jgi:hypothetical protein
LDGVHDVVATALIAGGSTATVGVFGTWFTYRGTRKQAAVAVAVAESQAEVERQRIQSELDRLRLEQEEPHLQHRQAVYHDFLNACHAFHQDQVGTSPMTQQQKADWFTHVEHCANAVGLFGTQDAYEAAVRLEEAMEVAVEADEYQGEAEDRYLAAYRATVDAMRKDTAPD